MNNYLFFVATLCVVGVAMAAPLRRAPEASSAFAVRAFVIVASVLAMGTIGLLAELRGASGDHQDIAEAYKQMMFYAGGPAILIGFLLGVRRAGAAGQGGVAQLASILICLVTVFSVMMLKA